MEIGTVKPVRIEDEIRVSYLDYAMSVIVSRSLPDVRDGLKPVHRRILYAMNELGLRHNYPYKKSARIVGEVLGKYHPHGDASVYEALVRMAQDFSMRYILVEGQGNFGSVDNDPPAAMRYTEARLAEIAQEVLVDIDRDTVDFVPNFDDSLKEPTILPARLPNLLVNGSSGIAVGMATNIPPHNLAEVCNAITHLIDNPEAGVDELLEYIKGPDFPTGGIILGQEEMRKAYITGQGKIVIQAKLRVEEKTKGQRRILITELPYQTNKAELVEKVANLVKGKRIEGISELRDESDREGMCIVIELKKEAQPQQVLNNLYKHTALRSAFFVNMLALVEGQPKVISLKEGLQYYIDFRQEVIVRRSRFELQQAKERAHILEGLKIALDHLDQVIAAIRRSSTTEVAREELMSTFDLSQAQAQAILDMQLRRLAALEHQKILDESKETLKTIAYLEDLLTKPERILSLIKEEIAELKSRYGDHRRTQLSEEEVVEFREEDLVPHQPMVITLSARRYIKRIPQDSYRIQHRGGRGLSGMMAKEKDAAQFLLLADTHNSLLFFTDRGKVYSLRCYQIPQEVSRTARGTPLINLLSLDPEEQITAVLSLKEIIPDKVLLLTTYLGKVKRISFQSLVSIRSSGLTVMDLAEGDRLIAARVAGEGDEIILMSRKGEAIRFRVNALRTSSRNSGGVRGLRLRPGDRIADMDTFPPGSYLLGISAKGFGKLTPVDAYPLQAKGGRGRRAHRVTSKSGEVVCARLVSPSQELMLSSSQGIIIRLPMESIPIQSRNTQGVGLMRLDPGDKVISIACF